jgi:dTMP kinase
MKKGKFVVIDGTDGSGKGTQVELLKQKLKILKTPFEVIDFPRYEDNDYGRLVGRYLKGDFGPMESLNPYLVALPYAGDRALAKPLIEKWLAQGKLVIANRYVPSNKAFSAARMSPKEGREFIDWDDQLEYETNKIPREDLVLLLYVDPKVIQQNVDQKEVRGYMGQKARDIHEANFAYQKKVAKTYLQLAESENHWHVVQCMQGKTMRTREEIHEEILQALKDKKMI